MPTLNPNRNVNEKDIINYYAFSGTLPVNKGTLVKVVGSGFVASNDPIEMLGSPGASYNNVVSQRYGVGPKVGTCGTGDLLLGITLFDVKETDENGNLLKWDLKRAWEREIVISGQALPIARRGMFHYSGITGSATAGGQKLYQGINGTLDVLQLTPQVAQVGITLGAKEPNGFCHVLLEP